MTYSNVCRDLNVGLDAIFWIRHELLFGSRDALRNHLGCIHMCDITYSHLYHDSFVWHDTVFWIRHELPSCGQDTRETRNGHPSSRCKSFFFFGFTLYYYTLLPKTVSCTNSVPLYIVYILVIDTNPKQTSELKVCICVSYKCYMQIHITYCTLFLDTHPKRTSDLKIFVYRIHTKCRYTLHIVYYFYIYSPPHALSLLVSLSSSLSLSLLSWRYLCIVYILHADTRYILYTACTYTTPLALSLSSSPSLLLLLSIYLSWRCLCIVYILL